MAFNKDKVMDSARKFAEKNQLDKAVKEYLRVVQEDPKDVRVWLKIGDLYVKRGAKQEATETYLKVAVFYQDQGFFLKAVAVYKQILKIDPRLVDVNLKLAELYKQLGLLSDAQQHFEAVAGHFHREGKTKEALAAVRQLVDLDPENVATRIKLAELYSKETLVAEAVTEFSNACEQLRKQNRQEDFLKVAERLLWHQPENYDLARELAALYIGRNDARRALQKLQICFKADPRDVETLALLAQAFQGLDQKSKTVSVLKELAKIHDDNRHRDKADLVFRKILEFAPTDADALARLGSAARTPAPGSQAGGNRLADSKVSLTGSGSVPAIRAEEVRRTGSFSLIDDHNAADFLLPDEGDGDGDDSQAYVALAEDGVDDGLESAAGVDEVMVEHGNDGGESDFSAALADSEGSYRGGSIEGERHAEEISKVLAETDVYVKYGLHQKAIDHLKRVFVLDTANLEARDRLKDIYLAQGREAEALAALVKLAEDTAADDPVRAAGYVREALVLDPDHRAALDIARRHRLDLTPPSEDGNGDEEYAEIHEYDEATPTPTPGATAHQGRSFSASDADERTVAGGIDDDLDFDSLDFDEGPRAPLPKVSSPSRPDSRPGRGERYDRQDSIDNFDPNELIGAKGSPAPGRPPGFPAGAPATVAGVGITPRAATHRPPSISPPFDPLAQATAGDEFELLGNSVGAETRQIVSSANHGLARGQSESADELEFDELLLGAPGAPESRAATEAREARRANRDAWSSGPTSATDSSIDHRGVSAKSGGWASSSGLGNQQSKTNIAPAPENLNGLDDDEMPFDAAAAREFDDDARSRASQQLEISIDESVPDYDHDVHDRPTGVGVDAAPEVTDHYEDDDGSDVGVVMEESISGVDELQDPALEVSALGDPFGIEGDGSQDFGGSTTFDSGGGEFLAQLLAAPAPHVEDPVKSEMLAYPSEGSSEFASSSSPSTDPSQQAHSLSAAAVSTGASTTGFSSTGLAPPAAPAAASLEDDLVEADFYVTQGMHAEAIKILRNLLQQYPAHPLVTEKLRDLEDGFAHTMWAGKALQSSAGHEIASASAMTTAAPAYKSRPAITTDAADAVEEVGLDERSEHTAPLDINDISDIDDLEMEEVDADDFQAVDEVDFEQADSLSTAPAVELHEQSTGSGEEIALPRRSSGPAIMLQRPVEDSDAETHYDLGMAYKEMGLFDEAIKAFELITRVPSREVQCRLMLGLCYREQGKHGEAVEQWKAALHASEISERERQNLYYEIGVGYEALTEPREALYYYEMVIKRDPAYLDTAKRVASLRAGGATANSH